MMEKLRSTGDRRPPGIGFIRPMSKDLYLDESGAKTWEASCAINKPDYRYSTNMRRKLGENTAEYWYEQQTSRFETYAAMHYCGGRAL